MYLSPGIRTSATLPFLMSLSVHGLRTTLSRLWMMKGFMLYPLARIVTECPFEISPRISSITVAWSFTTLLSMLFNSLHCRTKVRKYLLPLTGYFEFIGSLQAVSWPDMKNDSMKKPYGYTVAGHSFAVTMPERVAESSVLGNYAPFRDSACHDDGNLLFRLEVSFTDELENEIHGELKECLNDEAPYLWIFGDGGEERLSFGFSYSRSRPDCILRHSGDFSEAVVYVRRPCNMEYMRFAIDNSLMLLYTFRSAPFGTLMVHASVVEMCGGGYMFLGRSGTGKSTHSSLWLRNIAGTSLLNDDNPVVRVEQECAYVYGTPWSGKTPCYRNMSVPLKSIVRLLQAPHNRIERLSAINSYASLLPSCSCMRWDCDAVGFLHSAVEKVISCVPCWHLDCLPDDAAARVCMEAVTQNIRP